MKKIMTDAVRNFLFLLLLAVVFSVVYEVGFRVFHGHFAPWKA